MLETIIHFGECFIEQKKKRMYRKKVTVLLSLDQFEKLVLSIIYQYHNKLPKTLVLIFSHNSTSLREH